MPGGRPFLIAAAVVLAGGVIAAAWLLRPDAPMPEATFVGSDACAGCHQQAFTDWQQSHHHHAMHPVSEATVLGDFNDAHFEYAGTRSRFFRRDDGWFVETDDARGSLQTFRIGWTFGWYPLQQYLVEMPDGRLQALSITWDSRAATEGGQRWYHLYPDERVTHEDPLHWTGAFQNWNSRCAACHTTDLRKNYSRQEDRYATRWQETGVGCEACHGPASRHLSWAEAGAHAADNGFTTRLGVVWQAQQETPEFAPPAGMSPQLQVCSACHARRTELQQPAVTTPFLDNFTLSPLLDGMYHADGQILEEVFETGSFLQSRMHQNHVSCTNCHEPHAARLKAQGNALCLQCHEPARFQSEAHFFHAPDSAGAQCVNCHMPARTYMGIDTRRDHSFRVPDPIASARHGVPDACTQCHEDRDAAWAAAVIRQRTGRTDAWYAHTELIAGARAGDAAVAPALLAYAADARQPPMLRAIALAESARFASQAQVDVVAGALVDDNPLVRTGAASALAPLDARARAAALAPLLDDPVKSVRLAAARQLADLPVERAPADLQPALRAAFAEYRQALLHNADMPESMNDLGVFLSSQGDAQGAEEAFVHARRLAPRYLPAMLNLSDAWRARGRDDLGEPLLREALEEYPDSADAHHMLGLLYVRTGRTPASVALFRQAMELAPDNARHALVHAMSLVETGQREAGLRALEAAVRRFPADAALRQTLDGYRSGAR